MNIDRDKLRALAEAATTGAWGNDGSSIAPSRQEGGTTYVESWRAIGQMVAVEDAKFVAAACPSTVLALLAEIDQLSAEITDYQAGAARYEDLVEHFKRREQEALERAAYWRQRAKSAEGHFWNGDCRAAFEEVHRASNYAETPVDQLEVWQVARIESVVVAVLRTVNAQRQRRRPADFVDYREALIRVINHVEGNTESLVRDLVNWGTPKVDPNDFYDECEQIKAIAANALDKEMAEKADTTDRRDNQNLTRQED